MAKYKRVVVGKGQKIVYGDKSYVEDLITDERKTIPSDEAWDMQQGNMLVANHIEWDEGNTKTLEYIYLE